ncbi:MAG TPA: hypothetical protein VFI37_06070 [Gaiellaceae bacterium]|nr:hypothetical protein [Gaiellaceae bacterium]
MIGLPATFSAKHYIRLFDAVIAVWVALWIGVGYLVYHYVNGLGSLSDTVILAGRAVDATADAIGAISKIPFLGGQVDDLLQKAHRASQSAVYNGRASRQDVHNLAVLLWIAISAAPTTPLLVIYGLLRRGWQRDRRSLEEAVLGWEDDDALERFLARRALEHLPYRRLRRLSANPWRDYEEGRTTALADAELARVGVLRPRTTCPPSAPPPA